MRGPLTLLLLSLVLGAGAWVAAVAAQESPTTRQSTAPDAPAVTPVPTPTPTPSPSPTPAPTPEPGATSPTARAPEAQPGPEVPPTLLPSRALGRPFRNGRLVRGVQFPVSGPDHYTWDAPLQRIPNRPWRRWGTDALVGLVLRVLAEHRAAHPEAPPLLVGDLSLPQGGPFGAIYGGLGHGSHQNGLDVDIYYPRKDRRLIEPARPADVDRVLSQDLVDRFIAAGAQFVFVGPHVGLHGPRKRVLRLVNHDDHFHVRIYDPDGVG